MNVTKIREFNRCYARVLGIFDKKYLGVDFSVTEVRIIGEIDRNPSITAKELANFLGVDKGYLSRTIQSLEKKELLVRVTSEKDAREKNLKLTEKGKDLNFLLEEKANKRIQEQIKNISDADYQHLLDAMDEISVILTKSIPDIKHE